MTASGNSHAHAGPEKTAHHSLVKRIAGRRILIVEDDVSLASFLSAELESQQFAVDLLHDGEEALAALEAKRRYDLLILDLNLPKLDGISLIRQIRPSHPRRVSR